MPEARTGKSAAKARTGDKPAQSTQPARGLSGATALSTGTVATPESAVDGSAPGAIAALEQDHRHVEQLFADYKSATEDRRKDELIQEICTALIIHTKLEEEIFYPACRAAADDEDPLDEAQVEHDSAKLLIADLLEGSSDDPYRDAKVSVLSEQIKHHVGEEEKPEEGIFAKAKAHDVDTPDLARQLAQRKQNLQGRAADLRPTRAVSLNVESQEGFMPRYGSNERDRDERGRFISDDDDRGGRRYASRGEGRRYYYYDDDDDDGRGHGRGGWFGDSEGHSRAARSRFDDDDRRSPRSRYDDDDRRSSRSRYDDNDDGRGHGRGGWFGDSEGHSRAARGRFDDDDRDYRSRGRYDDDDRGGRGRGRGGWFGDSEGHAEAARQRWDEDNRGYRSRGGRYDDDDDDDRGHGRGGWFGDSEGHSEAARRGARSRSRDDDDDDRRGSRSRGSSHGGWFGDSRGHAEASRRGWQNRR